MLRRFSLGLICAALGTAAAGAQNQPFLSEIHINPPGTDQGQEFIEIRGSANFDLSGYYVIIIEGDGTGAGTVDQVLSLSGRSTGANGLFLWRDTATVLNPAPEAATVVYVEDFVPDIENGSNTYVLGFGTPPTLATDYDATDSGTLDPAAFANFTIVDAVGLIENDTGVNIAYADDLGGVNIGPFTGWTPDLLYRLLDCATGGPLAADSWAGGDVTGAAPGPYTISGTNNFGWGPTGLDPATITANPGSTNIRVGCSGACCLAGGFCVITTAPDCASSGGTYQGDNSTCSIGLCPSAVSGACCLPSGACLADLSPGDCAASGGSYAGDSVTCDAANCPQPTGACCELGQCSIATAADCAASGGHYLGDNSACTPNNPCPTPAPSVDACDLAVGLSLPTTASVRLARGGIDQGAWTPAPFVQSVEFDNSNGPFSHTSRGNLLGLDFGATCGGPDTGANLWNLSTDGSDRAQRLLRFNGVDFADCTRATGLSVSPDNTKIAIFGHSTGSLYVLNYNAGGAVGTGTGASVTAGSTFPFFATQGVTQGTAWLDDTTVLGAIVDPFNPANNALQAVDITNGNFSVLESFPGRGSGSMFLDVEYNPTVSPYVYVMQSALTAGVSQTTVYVIDLAQPQGSRVVKTVILDTSSQTGRELALACDGYLVIGEYAGSQAPQPKVYADRLDLDLDDDGDIDAADTVALTDNSSTDYYVLQGGASASFSGLDVALRPEPVDPCFGFLLGDSDGSGAVNNFDIDAFVLAISNPHGYLAQYCDGNPDCLVCRNDLDHSSAVNNFDIDAFVACLNNLPPSGQPCP